MGIPFYGGIGGAIVLGRDIDTARRLDENNVGLADTTGLDLALGYAFWCHFVSEDDVLIREGDGEPSGAA